MKKLLMFTAAAFVLTAPAAFAEEKAAEEAKKPDRHIQRMEMLDTDKDGKVSKAEFLAQHEKHFTEMDTDGDGFISKEETEARRAAWQEKMKEKRAKKEAEKSAAPAGEEPAPSTEDSPPAGEKAPE